MDLSNILLQLNTSSIKDFIPLEKVKDAKDKENYEKLGYLPYYTLSEFKKEYPEIDHKKMFYNKDLFRTAYYFDAAKFILIQLHVGPNGFLLPNKKERNNNDALKDVVSAFEQKYNNKNYGYLLSRSSNSLTMELLNLMIENLHDPALLDTFRTFYTTTDYGCKSISKDSIKKIYGYADKAFKEKTLKELESYENMITIYRGEANESTPYPEAYSWSLDKNVANFFATRLGKEGRIITARIDKDKILDYIDESEEEIIALNDDIEIVNIENLYDTDDLISEFDSVSYYFFKFKKEINNLHFVHNTKEHGKLHTLRVLFLGLLIMVLEELDLELNLNDIHKICTAIVYHDIGRISDDVDSEHGRYSYNEYKKLSKQEDPELEFLITYHCLSDTSAKKFLASSKNIKEERKETLWTMYQVIKDADALDRVRFGIRDLDIKFLRLNSSLKLTKVAVQAINGLKI